MVAASNAVFGAQDNLFLGLTVLVYRKLHRFGVPVSLHLIGGNRALSVFQQSGRRRVARYVCRNDDIF